MKTLFVLGGTGFIGVHLINFYLQKGWKISLLTRNPSRLRDFGPQVEAVVGDAMKEGAWIEAMVKADLVINLVGESIFKRWNEEYKKRLWDSRIIPTQIVSSHLREGQVLFNASAVGYYGDGGERELDEDSPQGNLYVSDLCKAWEERALEGEKRGARVIVGRLGIVLGRGGGMLSVILPIFKSGLGGRLGSGRQWFPWIHVDDIARAIDFLCEKGERGIFNFTAPNPIRNKEMTEIIGRIIKRPTLFPVPRFALKILYGELADVIMASAKVLPRRLLRLGFKFKFERFEEALRASI